MVVSEYTIQLQIYHNEIVGRLVFTNASSEIEESSLYSLSELENIIALWRDGVLIGSFAIGTRLAHNPVQRLTQQAFN